MGCDGFKGKGIFFLGFYVVGGVGVRVIVLFEGLVVGKIWEGMRCWWCCFCDVFCVSYFVVVGLFYLNFGREFWW